nr:hypothetical protein [Propionivibrio dicarboxylicus]
MNRAAIGLAVVAVLAIAMYFFGRSNEHNANEANKVAAVEGGVKKHNQAAIAGGKAESNSAARKVQTEAFFNAIQTKEISYAQTHSAPQCRLDPDGLCLWIAANANADPDTTCSGYGALRTAATTGERDDRRSADESHRGGEGVSPVQGSAPGADRLAGGDR